MSPSLYLFLKQESRQLAFDFLAGLLGLFTAILLKVLILRYLRASGYGGFYRRRPAAANFENLILECWNLGLTTGYVMGRVLKLILLSIFYIGRVDTNFFANNVGWLGTVPLDGYPMAFMKDLLAHEAVSRCKNSFRFEFLCVSTSILDLTREQFHELSLKLVQHRHPYMERWALLYLLKLRHKSDFGRRSSAIWRILFVRALFPWLQKYRASSERTCLQSRNSLMRSRNEANATRSLEDENLRLQQEIRSLRIALEKEQSRRNINSDPIGRRQNSLRASLLAGTSRWKSTRQSLVSSGERNSTSTGRRESLQRASQDVQDRWMSDGGGGGGRTSLSGSFASCVSVLEC